MEIAECNLWKSYSASLCSVDRVGCFQKSNSCFFYNNGLKYILPLVHDLWYASMLAAADGLLSAVSTADTLSFAESLIYRMRL